MSIIETDRSLEVIKTGYQIPAKLEKLLITDKLSVLNINLINWKNSGLRIGVVIPQFGECFYNNKPYTNKEEALSEYARVTKEVSHGNYILLIHGNYKIELFVGNDLIKLNIPTLTEKY